VVRADLVAGAGALIQPEWIAAQRWYGANDRTLERVALADAAPLPQAAGTDPEAWLLVAEAGFSDGGTSRYLIPAVADPTSSLHEPRDGDGVWKRLAQAIASGAVLAGETATVRCEVSEPLHALLPRGVGALADAKERRLTGEQTNTSVTIGERLILKVYRRLQLGENPELEVGTFLESVGCRVMPRMAGAARLLDTQIGTAAAAMLQERVATTGDAWRQTLDMLAQGESGWRAAERAAATIGSVTAELHTCLASRPQDVAFPARPARSDELAQWRTGARTQLDAAGAALEGEGRIRLAGIAPALVERLEAAFSAAVGASVSRIHGDYHLGQLLATDDGYVVIDFEGEPARPLAERRAPQPPERDVAGMLRSFDYAARTAGARNKEFDASAWVPRAREAFLDAYAADAPRRPDPGLVAAFELEKACYEVRYEAANRPEWTWLPLDALSRLAERR
jgi:trehalose synthase-fused probable maltokinase